MCARNAAYNSNHKKKKKLRTTVHSEFSFSGDKPKTVSTWNTRTVTSHVHEPHNYLYLLYASCYSSVTWQTAYYMLRLIQTFHLVNIPFSFFRYLFSFFGDLNRPSSSGARSLSLFFFFLKTEAFGIKRYDKTALFKKYTTGEFQEMRLSIRDGDGEGCSGNKWKRSTSQKTYKFCY